MKRLFLLLLFIFPVMVPSGTFGRPATGPSVTLAGEKELEKRVKGMTQEQAQAILRQAEESYPPGGQGWQLFERTKDSIMFMGIGGVSTWVSLSASVSIKKNKFKIIFALFDIYDVINLERLNKDWSIAIFNTVTGIENHGLPIKFPYDNEARLFILNHIFLDDGTKEGIRVPFGRTLATTKETITIMGGSVGGSWQLNNPEAVYAAALVLKPDLTFDEFLAAASMQS